MGNKGPDLLDGKGGALMRQGTILAFVRYTRGISWPLTSF